MTIEKRIILESKKLKLRIPSLDDISEIFTATRYDGLNDGMLWEAPYDMEELAAPYHRGIKAWEEGRAYNFNKKNGC